MDKQDIKGTHYFMCTEGRRQVACFPTGQLMCQLTFHFRRGPVFVFLLFHTFHFSIFFVFFCLFIYFLDILSCFIFFMFIALFYLSFCFFQCFFSFRKRPLNLSAASSGGCREQDHCTVIEHDGDRAAPYTDVQKETNQKGNKK